MITKPTVFVLGAGASRPYGFPLGRQLRDSVVRGRVPSQWRLSPRSMNDLARELGKQDVHTAFVKALQTSGYSSVDWFLEKNPRFTDIGTITIAATLIPCESDRHLFPPNAPRRDHWYEVFANMLDVGERKYLRNRVTIVTYNYDRSLEQYLARVMLNRLPNRGSTLWRHYEHIPVLHLHGQLGEFGSEISSSKKSIPYGSDADAKAVQIAARGIRVIHEAKPTTKAFISARNALREAERIYFLGFGYNPANVTRLQVFNRSWSAARRAKCTVLGTSVGMSAREWEQTCRTAFNENMQLRPRFRQGITAFLRDVVEVN